MRNVATFFNEFGFSIKIRFFKIYKMLTRRTVMTSKSGGRLLLMNVRPSSSNNTDGTRPPGKRSNKQQEKNVTTTSKCRSEFVDRIRTLEYWTRSSDDKKIENEFHRAKLILMVNERAAMCSDAFVINPNNGRPQLQGVPRLRLFNTIDLQNKLNQYGLHASVPNSALLSIYPTSPDEGGDYAPIFGTNVVAHQPSKESGIPRDSPFQVLARELDVQFLSVGEAMLMMTDPEQRELLAKFYTITKWYPLFIHCPTCAQSIKMRASKSWAQCEHCERTFYPDLFPCAITLVRDESNEHVLLVRHKNRPAPLYTCISGFCSPGENLDQTVRREIAEEVGIEVRDVCTLQGSQAWPLPTGSLMVPFVATASMDDEISPCSNELEHAKWFSRDKVADALRRTEQDPQMSSLKKHLSASGKDPEARLQLRYIPPQGAIAHHIIREWVLRKI